MANVTAIEFDLVPVEVPVRVGKENYVLREASAGAAEAYRGNSMRGAYLEEGKVHLGNSMAQGESLLVSMCLCHTEGNKPGVVRINPATKEPAAVRESLVKSWPDKVVRALFDRVKEISPNLIPDDDTAESLTKQIDKLTAKRDKLAAAAVEPAGESAAKNSPGATTGTSV